MSVVLLERAGALGQAVEATLRLNLNRGNQWFWQKTAGIPLAKWPAYRDGQIKEIFDSLKWLPIWELPDGEYVVRQGMGQTVAIKNGDVIRFYDISARRRRYDLDEVWRRGEPCPYAYSEAEIAALWDERVHNARLSTLDSYAPDDSAFFDPWRKEAIKQTVSEILSLARQARWEDAITLAEREYEEDRRNNAFGVSVLLSMTDYLRLLCRG